MVADISKLTEIETELPFIRNLKKHLLY